jgi:Protein of unknown function (DUF3303)
MKFVITWSVPAESYQAAIKKFLETGAQPPAGVKMLGRYHGPQGHARLHRRGIYRCQRHLYMAGGLDGSVLV